MKILILGGSGMVGHKLWQVFSGRFETYVTVRQAAECYARYNLFDPARMVGHVSVQDFDGLVRAMTIIRPRVTVNCIGIVKQAAMAKDPLMSLSVNALFPHRLAQVCQAVGSRLIHISTDCVFSGRQGNYQESDVADADDLYGRTKLLGEVSYDHCLTLRASLIGRELSTSHGLMEWFLSQKGRTIPGYTRAIFSGFTTQALAELLAQIITDYPDLQGLWHVASEPISKFELLRLAKQVYGLTIQIEPDETVVYDRSLNADRFRRRTGFVPPSWPEMIEQMYRDPTPYGELRRRYAQS